jgi:hypothetical protein
MLNELVPAIVKDIITQACGKPSQHGRQLPLTFLTKNTFHMACQNLSNTDCGPARIAAEGQEQQVDEDQAGCRAAPARCRECMRHPAKHGTQTQKSFLKLFQSTLQDLTFQIR